MNPEFITMSFKSPSLHTLSSPFMRFRIMRFSIYAEVRSSKNDSPFMPFSQIIPHLCGFKNMNFLNCNLD